MTQMLGDSGFGGNLSTVTLSNRGFRVCRIPNSLYDFAVAARSQFDNNDRHRFPKFL